MRHRWRLVGFHKRNIPCHIPHPGDPGLAVGVTGLPASKAPQQYFRGWERLASNCKIMDVIGFVRNKFVRSGTPFLEIVARFTVIGFA